MWTDEKYAWDPDDFCGIDEITVGAKRVWRPEVVLYNR